MNHRIVLPALVLIFVLESCSGFFTAREPDDFITVKGTQFIHNSKPYYYAGTNLWYGCYLGSPGPTGNRERLLRELDSLQALGLMNLRVLAASEESYIKRSVKPAIQKAPGVVDEDLLIGLDFLLAEMEKRHMHAVMYLNNYWEWSGGMAQYNVWANGGEGMDPENPAHGWRAFMLFSAKFYGDRKANEMYRNFVKNIVTRKNSCNGRYYPEDPTIMSWQLANEPRPGPDGPETQANLPTFNRWIDETASYIHSLDTNHLVSTGSEGTIGFAWAEEPYVQAHQFRSIDYVTCHVWPKNWGWFDPLKFEETLPSSEEKALEYIRKHCLLAREMGKPLVMEEFGLARDSAACAPGSPTTARDRYFAKVFSVVYDSARAGSPLAGTNFWTWGGEGKAQHPDNMWRPGDPFLGDPPQEPQGFNSVFYADTTTIRIIREHAFKMMRLGAEDSLYAYYHQP
ncbi:MAG: mannanase [Bacteroidetes bacterium]|nr:mannanase [Bacteroidota bacterium]